jgi:hypothetical protein
LNENECGDNKDILNNNEPIQPSSKQCWSTIVWML